MDKKQRDEILELIAMREKMTPLLLTAIEQAVNAGDATTASGLATHLGEMTRPGFTFERVAQAAGTLQSLQGAAVRAAGKGEFDLARQLSDHAAKVEAAYVNAEMPDWSAILANAQEKKVAIKNAFALRP